MRIFEMESESDLKRPFEDSVKIYATWDASENAHYGFIYRYFLKN